MEKDQVIVEVQHASKLLEDFIRRSKTAADHSQWIGYKIALKNLTAYLNGERQHLLTPEDERRE